MDEKQRSVKLSYTHSFFLSMSMGFGERYVEAFANFLRATNTQFGLIVSLPQFMGSIFQLFTMRLLRLFGSRKRMHMSLTVVQACLWIPMIVLSLHQPPYAFWIYLGLVSLYITINTIINPVWSSWVMDLVEPEKRARYFGTRLYIMNFVGFISFVIGGWILQHEQTYGFLIMFTISICALLVSAYVISKKYEPPFSLVVPKVDFGRFLTSMQNRDQRRSIFYLISMIFAVYISSAYFTPYLLRTLQMNYFLFSVLIIAPMLPKILMSRQWGKVIDYFGPGKVLPVASGFIILNPLLWLFHDSFWYLFIVQIYAGFSWGLYEHTAVSFLLNTTNPANRISLLSYHAFFNGMGILLGSLTGILIVTYGPLQGYFSAFLVSGIVRFFVLLTYPRMKEQPIYGQGSYTKIATEVSSFFSMSDLSRKIIAAKDIDSIRLTKNTKKSKQIISVGFTHKALVKNVKERRSDVQLYMCRNCNAEFRHRKGAKTNTSCIYCGSKNCILLREMTFKQGKEKE